MCRSLQYIQIDRHLETVLKTIFTDILQPITCMKHFIKIDPILYPNE